MITSEDIIGYELAPYHRLKEDLQRFLVSWHTNTDTQRKATC